MYPKIDIYVNHKYVCSTMQAKNCKEAVAKFSKNPTYAVPGGMIKIDSETIYNVTAKLAEEK